jgi:hypothetical protein
MVDNIAAERQRLTERLAGIDAERTRLADQLAELDTAERVLSRLSPAKAKRPRQKRAQPKNANGSATAKASRRGPVARGRKANAKAAPPLGEAALRAVSALRSEVSAEQVREYLAKELGMQVRPNYLGRALQRHRVSGRLSESDGRWSMA